MREWRRCGGGCCTWRTGLAAPGDAAASCRACVGSSAENQLDTPAASLLTLKSSAGPAPAPAPPPNSCTRRQTKANTSASTHNEKSSMAQSVRQRQRRDSYTPTCARDLQNAVRSCTARMDCWVSAQMEHLLRHIACSGLREVGNLQGAASLTVGHSSRGVPQARN